MTKGAFTIPVKNRFAALEIRSPIAKQPRGSPVAGPTTARKSRKQKRRHEPEEVTATKRQRSGCGLKFAVGRAMYGVKYIGQMLVSPFTTPYRLDKLEAMTIEQRNTISALKERIRTLEEDLSKAHSSSSSSGVAFAAAPLRTPAAAASAAPSTPVSFSIPPAPPMYASSIPTPPPFDMPPPPPRAPPLGDFAVPTAPPLTGPVLSGPKLFKATVRTATFSFNEQSAKKPAGITLEDITKVKLRRYDPNAAPAPKPLANANSNANANGRPVFSVEQLQAVKLRKVVPGQKPLPKSPSASSSLGLLSPRSKPAAAVGLDLREMSAIKLRRAPQERSPGGTPLKRPQRPGILPANSENAFLINALANKFKRSPRTRAMIEGAMAKEEGRMKPITTSPSCSFD